MLTVAHVDGWSVVAVAALSAGVTCWQGLYFMAGIAVPVLLAGAAELRGRRLVLNRQPRGVDLMIGAQLSLLLIIWLYTWYRWHFFSAPELWAELPRLVQDYVTDSLRDAGLDPELHRDHLLAWANKLTCITLAAVSLAYQGGLAFWYARQSAAVRQALLASP